MLSVGASAYRQIAYAVLSFPTAASKHKGHVIKRHTNCATLSRLCQPKAPYQQNTYISSMQLSVQGLTTGFQAHDGLAQDVDEYKQ